VIEHFHVQQFACPHDGACHNKDKGRLLDIVIMPQ
jgi:hypothetical protein